MNLPSLVSLLQSWAVTVPCRLTAEVRPAPPALFELPAGAAPASGGLLVEVSPDPHHPDACLGVWVPETGEGRWMMTTEPAPAVLDLCRLPPCPTPAAVVTEVDRLTRELITILNEQAA